VGRREDEALNAALWGTGFGGIGAGTAGAMKAKEGQGLKKGVASGFGALAGGAGGGALASVLAKSSPDLRKKLLAALAGSMLSSGAGAGAANYLAD